MSLFSKMFKSYSEKSKKISTNCRQNQWIRRRNFKIKWFRIKRKNRIFQKELENGKTLDDILPEAFAVVREASKEF